MDAPAATHMLVQWLLPLADNDGRRFPPESFAAVRRELTERFGGVTAYPRAPAVGLWDDAGDVQRDDLVLFEVLVAEYDRAWWSEYRQSLCRRFRQEAILVRAVPCELP